MSGRPLPREGLVVQPKPLRDARSVRDRYDIGSKRQPSGDLAPFLSLQVKRDAPLPAVHADEAAALVRRDRRCVPPGIALRPLNLHDVRAHIGQHHRAVRPRDVLGEVDDLDSGERPSHGRIVCEGDKRDKRQNGDKLRMTCRMAGAEIPSPPPQYRSAPPRELGMTAIATPACPDSAVFPQNHD